MPPDDKFCLRIISIILPAVEMAGYCNQETKCFLQLKNKLSNSISYTMLSCVIKAHKAAQRDNKRREMPK